MSKTSEHSIHALELNTVLELLSCQAVSDEAKELARSMEPSSDLDDVTRLQNETGEAHAMILLKGSPSFQALHDVSDSLFRADRGGCLTAAELLRIAQVLRCTANMKAYCDADSEFTILKPYFFSLQTNKYLEEHITGCIISEEEISDSASPELSDIRRHMRIQSAKVRDSLQKIISSPSYAKYLREPIITIRSDRYVVPVKSEFKNEISGLVHDVSSSGGTFFVEPISVVNANNALRELLAREKSEIERILAELSSEVAAHKDQISDNYRLLVKLDLIFARAKLALLMDASQPELHVNGSFELISARHPLIDKSTVVPISFRLGSDFDALIITGPNTGGKTVTLKTAGLLTLMAECGLWIPAKNGSSVNLFETVYADIGDEQSIEQSLSTFSSHMKAIVDVVETCDKDSLVLFDELGAGTDPAEGAALAISIIQFCRKIGAKVIATTHYAELKLFALRTEGVMNASCEFDVNTLRPTYKLLIGIPGKSNAFAIAEKLGLPSDIISEAGNLLSRNNQDFEDVIHQLHVQRMEMESAKEETVRIKAETERLREKSEEYYREMKAEREKALQKARKDAQLILDDARRTANAAADELKQLRKQLAENADVRGLNEKQAEIRKNINDAESRVMGSERPAELRKSSRKPIPGDTVELLKYNTRADVLSVSKDGIYTLQAGIMKVTAKENEIYLLDSVPKTNAKKIIEKTSRQFHNEVGVPEVDLRGMTAGEASIVLAQFIDNAVMSRLPSVRIIHGKGTGVLRQTVHDDLRMNRLVKKFRLGTYGEGEDGVTIAEL